MGFWNGMWEMTKAFASGEATRELGQIFKEAGRDFLTDVLEIGVDEKIDRDVAAHEMANRIRQKLDDGDYSTVNIGLTAEVSKIRHSSHRTNVDFSVYDDNYDEVCQIKMNSEYGTDLEVGERLKLKL